MKTVFRKNYYGAKDGGVDLEEAKAIMLSVWDKSKESMRIDLWTKKCLLMKKIFFHQTLFMSDTFHRATGDEKMAETMKDFLRIFCRKVRLKKEVILKKKL
jgi:gliding motility-associated protein GldC